MTNDALTFVGRINALGPPIVANQTPLWLQEVQAIAGIATTIGVRYTSPPSASPGKMPQNADTTQNRSKRSTAPNRLVLRLKHEKCCPRALERLCLVKRRGQ